MEWCVVHFPVFPLKTFFQDFSDFFRKKILVPAQKREKKENKKLRINMDIAFLNLLMCQTNFENLAAP